MATQVAKLEKALTDAPADPNPLLPLLALARHADPSVAHKAAWALYRVFGAQLASGRVGGVTGSGEVDGDASAGLKGSSKVRAWIRDRLLEYVAVLGGLLSDAEESLRQSALQLLFALLPPLSAAARVPIHMPYFRMLVGYLLAPVSSPRGTKAGGKPLPEFQEGEAGELPADVADAVVESYWAPYDDLRLFFFREAAAAVAADKITHADNLMSQLVQLTNLPKEQADLNAFFIPALAEPPSDPERKRKKGKASVGGKRKKSKGGDVDALPEWMETYESGSDSDAEETTGGKRKRASALGTHAAVHSVKAHVAAYTDAWEAVLSSLALDQAWTRRVLAGLHGKRGILAHWAPARRVRLADWLGGTVDAGGAHALLAMNGLFVLMTTYNLDYPRFYERLYALLDAEVLHARYRARFFRLLDTFLRSPLLSAALIAAFIKRLARLSLSAPPAGAIIVIPFVYNLFKRHPGAMPMLHRLADDTDANGDPYDADEPVPAKSRAIDSSVWELAALQNHYLAPIATLAKIFSEQFTKPEFNLEDFLDHGYGTLFETETNRRLKYAPALSMEVELGGETTPMFPAPGEAGPRDAVTELWAF